ncbi:MAG: glycoside hydrolase family 19 protein [bacterium]
MNWKIIFKIVNLIKKFFINKEYTNSEKEQIDVNRNCIDTPNNRINKPNKTEEIEMMKELITEEQFKKLFPRADISFVSVLNQTLRKNNIDTLERVASFLAQTGHESAMYTVFSENLNYSRKALLKVFPKHFNEDNVDEYTRNPEKIANRAYRNRMGNGDEASGDGWKYRGRGLIQLTGKNNYIAFAKSINKSLEDVIEYINTFEGRVESAIWYWNTNNLNNFADNYDIRGQTRVINGGFNGIKHRLEIYNKVKEILIHNF